MIVARQSNTLHNERVVHRKDRKGSVELSRAIVTECEGAGVTKAESE